MVLKKYDSTNDYSILKMHYNYNLVYLLWGLLGLGKQRIYGMRTLTFSTRSLD
jgi:hypothetical protein